MKNLFYIIPECYVDTNLIEYLTNAHVNHQHCCSKVVGQLNSTLKDRFAVGIIDRDKVEVGYISECDVIATTPHLTLLKHNQRSQFLITINPAVDGFILDCAEKEGVDLKDFRLPANLKDFIKETKTITSNKDDRFKALFKVLHNNTEITNLRNSLDYLIQNGYKTEIRSLKQIFESSL